MVRGGPLGREARTAGHERAVSYWSLWQRLLLATPVVLALVGIAAVVAGGGLSLAALAPVPFVFLAATLGFAVRDMDLAGTLTSLSLGGVYAAVLVVTDVATLVLARPTALLALLGFLTSAAAVAGFLSPSLHGSAEDVIERARRRQWENR